jgi:cytochrome b561
MFVSLARMTGLRLGLQLRGCQHKQRPAMLPVSRTIPTTYHAYYYVLFGVWPVVS